MYNICVNFNGNINELDRVVGTYNDYNKALEMAEYYKNLFPHWAITIVLE